MNYTLHQLQIFLKIAELSSITKASEELYLTQPAVSIQLKNLQDQFAIPLTEVVGRQLYITEFGREIAQAAEKILEEVNAINYKTLAFQGKLSGKLKLSVVSTGKYVMPYFLSEFIKEHEGLELGIDVTNKLKVVETLEANKTDFALVSVLPDKLKVKRVELMENKLYFIANKSFGLKGKRLTKPTFEKLPLIYREDGSATRNAMETYIKDKNYTNLKKIELTSNEAVKQAVVAGLGCSIMPLIGLKNELKNGDVEILPIKGLPIKTSWNIIWLESKKLSPAALAYLEFLQLKKEEIIKDKFNWISQY